MPFRNWGVEAGNLTAVSRWGSARNGRSALGGAKSLTQLASAFVLSLLAVWLLLLSCHAALAADSAPAMVLPGQFNVSDNGAFTYKVPIAIPPGTAGMEPTLSLDYSNQGADGTAGWGWSLSGIPSIGRCPRTYAEDNVHGSVNFDANDRFCMEGERLVAISGTYGADGTVYRTEQDAFTQIVSHGTAGTGPAYFTAQAKSGQIMEFGNTTNSRVLAQGKTTVRSWGVDKLSDSNGNYITFTYMNNATTGEAYPIEIDYTGNAAAGQTPFNSVQFVYNTSRLYALPGYQAGSLVETTVLLTDVKTYTGVVSGGSAILVADYRLKYTPPASAAAHYELTSITQCDAASGGHCLQPTVFGWQGSKDALTLTGTANGLSQSGAIAPGYFQGSGLTDFATTSTAHACGIYFATASGFTFSSMNLQYAEWMHDDGGYYSIPYDGPACRTVGLLQTKRYVDINGDSLTDLLINQAIAMGSQATFQLVNNGSNIVQTSYPPGAPLTPPATYVADFNGDGRSDIFVPEATIIAEMFSNGDGTFTLGPYFNIGSSASWALADFDGNGCADVLQQGSTNEMWLSCNAAVASFSLPSAFATSNLVLGDFNGDGLTDVLAVPVSGNAALYTSTGTGFASPVTIGSSSDWYKYAIYTGDWNGDGKTDLVLVAPGGTGFYGPGTSP